MYKSHTHESISVLQVLTLDASESVPKLELLEHVCESIPKIFHEYKAKFVHHFFVTPLMPMCARLFNRSNDFT